MARALSQVYTIIRGSVGGLTYLANQYHQIVVRARTAPVQPNTTYQAMIRTAFTAALDVWANLDAKEQEKWDDYANATPFPGPLGPYTVTGRLIFAAGRSLQEYILARSLATPSFVTTAPIALAGFYDLKNVACVPPTGPGTGVAVTIGAETTSACAAFVEISPGFPKARKRYKGPWVTADSQAVIIPLNTSAIVEFLNLTVGVTYFIRVKAVADNVPPRISAAHIIRCIGQTV